MMEETPQGGGQPPLLPRAPNLRTVSHGGLFAVADNGRLKELRVLQELLLLGIRGDIGHKQVLVSPAFGVHQGGKPNFLLDGLVLPGG